MTPEETRAFYAKMKEIAERGLAKLTAEQSKPLALEPCPACGAEAKSLGPNYIWCSNQACAVIGPNGDSDGEKWNAMCRNIRMPLSMDKVYIVSNGIAKELSDCCQFFADVRAHHACFGPPIDLRGDK